MPDIAVCRSCIYKMKPASTGKLFVELVNENRIIILLDLAVPDFMNFSPFEEVNISLRIFLVYLGLDKLDSCESNNCFSFVHLSRSHCSLV